MNFEDLFILMCICCSSLLSWNIGLLESRDFWKRKWEKEIEKNE